MHNRTKDARTERGQSLVEFAFGLVVLIIMLAGVVDAGRALFTYLAMRDAAQEGAAYGSTHANISSGGVKGSLIARVCESSNFMRGLSCGDADNPPSGAQVLVQVRLNPSNKPCIGSAIGVRVTYETFPLTMPFLGALIGSQNVRISTSYTDTVLSPYTCP